MCPVKKILSVLCASLIASFSFAQVSSNEKIANGSFELAPLGFRLNGFSHYGGNWFAQASVVSVTPSPAARVVYDPVSFEEGEFFAEIDFEKPGGSAGVIFNVSNEGLGAENFTGYEVSFTSNFSRLDVVLYDKEAKPIISVPLAPTPDGWRKVGIMIGKKGLHVYIASDEVLVLPTVKPLGKGRIGFISHGAYAKFQNLRFHSNIGGKNVLLFGKMGESLSAMWDILPNSKNAKYYHDDVNPHDGEFSQMMSSKGGVAGLVSNGPIGRGFSIGAGQTFEGSAFIRGEGVKGSVCVSLQNAEGTEIYARQEISGIGSEWRKFPISLKSETAQKGVRFAVVLDGAGSLWVDSATLTPLQ